MLGLGLAEQPTHAAVGGVPRAEVSGGTIPKPNGSTKVVGNWGVLEVKSIYLEAPQALQDQLPRADQWPLWRFPSGTVAAVAGILAKAGLPQEVCAELLAPEHVESENGVTLLVEPRHILQLTAAARDSIYAELARHEMNTYYASPIIIIGDVDDWLRGSGLGERQCALLRQLVWHKGRRLAFSDLPMLLAAATTREERAAVYSCATRVRTLVAELEVPALSSVTSIAEYWVANWRNYGVRALLQSLARRAEVASVDLLHVLPRMARQLLYRFPSVNDAVGGRLPDCQWTALNFFAINPKPYYLDARASFVELTDDYQEVDRPGQLGDLVCLGDRAGQIVHSCVYVAGDIVFTKNGSSVLAPWVLQRLADVQEFYDQGEVDRVRYFRAKAASEGPD